MKKIIALITLISLFVPQLAFATPSSVDRITDHIEPLIKTDYIRAVYFVATSTTATSTLNGNLVVGNVATNGLSFDTVNGKLIIITGAPGAQFRGGGVAIGTTTDTTTKFIVNGGSALGTCINQSGITDGAIICGPVGVSTSTPGYPLTVQGDINYTGNLYQNGILFTSGNTAWLIGNGFIYTATSSDMVGVGSTTPGATLSVQGSSTFPIRPLLIVASSSNTQFFNILSSGNVGIGSTSPTDKLVVNGNISLDGGTVSITSAATTINSRAFSSRSGNCGSGTCGTYTAGSGNSTGGTSGAVTDKSGTGNITGSYTAGSGDAATGVSGASTFRAGTANSSTAGLTTLGGSNGALGGTTDVINGSGSAGNDGNIRIYSTRNGGTSGGFVLMQQVTADTKVSIGASTTPTAQLTIKASSTQTIPTFLIATSTDKILFKVNSDNSVQVGEILPFITATNTPVVANFNIASSTPIRSSFRIDPGATPSSSLITSGDMWNATSTNGLESYNGNIWGTFDRGIFTGTANKVITNTVADVTAIPAGLGTTTLPGNFLTVGKTIHIHGGGIYELPIAGGTATIKIKYGSVTVGSVTTSALLSTGTRNRFTFDAYMTTRVASTSGSVIVDGEVKYASAASGGYTTDAINNSGNTTTIDTTATSTLDVTAAFDTAVTTKIATTTIATYEVIN